MASLKKTKEYKQGWSDADRLVMKDLPEKFLRGFAKRVDLGRKLEHLGRPKKGIPASIREKYRYCEGFNDRIDEMEEEE